MSQVVHETALPLLRPWLRRFLHLLDCIAILRIIARHFSERNGTPLALDNLPSRTRFWVTVALSRSGKKGSRLFVVLNSADRQREGAVGSKEGGDFVVLSKKNRKRTSPTNLSTPQKTDYY